MVFSEEVADTVELSWVSLHQVVFVIDWLVGFC